MRALVVLALLAVGAATAAAKRAIGYGSAYEPRCDVQPEIYPRNGATGIPRNAHAWIVGGTLGNYSLRHDGGEIALTATTHAPFRIIEIPLGILEPNARYTLVYAGRELTTFTTSASTDTSLPEPPSFRGVSARTAGASAEADLLAISSREAVMMKLTIQTQHGREVIIAPERTIRNLGARCFDTELAPDDYVCFDLAELDGAGNRSAAVRRCTNVEEWHAGIDFVRDDDEYVLDPRWAAAIFLTVITLVCVFIVLLVRSANAQRVYQDKALSPIAPELVRKAALVQRYDAKAMLIACTVCCVLTALIGPEGCTALGWLPLAMVVTSLSKWLRVAKLLRSLDADKVAPRRAGRYVFVDNRWMVLKPSEVQQLVNEALPHAKIRS